MDQLIIGIEPYIPIVPGRQFGQVGTVSAGEFRESENRTLAYRFRHSSNTSLLLKYRGMKKHFHSIQAGRRRSAPVFPLG
jgi:hypothetical protein